MRVLLSSNHIFRNEAKSAHREPCEWPSGSGFYIHDLVAKGLAELGHEVFYLLPRGVAGTLPSGPPEQSAQQLRELIRTGYR